jgi:hypothetical protein
MLELGRDVTQAVGRQIPSAVARVRAWVKPRGICDGQSGTGAGLLRVLRFPTAKLSTDCSTLIIIIIITIIITIITIILGWYNRLVMASVIVDLAPLHPPKKCWN